MPGAGRDVTADSSQPSTAANASPSVGETRSLSLPRQIQGLRCAKMSYQVLTKHSREGQHVLVNVLLLVPQVLVPEMGFTLNVSISAVI